LLDSQVFSRAWGVAHAPPAKPRLFLMDKSERQSLFPSQAIIRQIVKHSSSQVTSLLVFGDPLQKGRVSFQVKQ